ncbi:hypothetical protein A9308_00050 [Moraxella atlantae]|mgnify:CR=1 FL=1|uniref:HMA domain-containing protein n=1 Tax=Faucicola atlantae TaxID=34059 RepID=A0A1B8QL95_9GAMM|nr:hypothetical protein [Moraxella atlantae]OBX79478.1 hypothetical protein A9308_00050 [Moraxella atlantae]OBX84487.1 hypothetical protein A9306_03150 [Moraxella atlantae]OPH36771.1 hypothetical protein B5J92_02660 [Moraxella atlantae]STY94513.1 Uncharacterised protein [Moraxella atlantae]
MPQTKYDIKVGDKAAADEFVKKTETVKGVKFVNVSTDGNMVVVTHGDDYDEAAFKAAAGIA